jgi:hypothetical protein
MSHDWRELLDRILDNDDLTDDEAAALAQSLTDPDRQDRAADLLAFRRAMSEELGPDNRGDVSRSRDRLLAKAVLREKSQAVRARKHRRVVTRWTLLGLAAATTLGLVVALAVRWIVPAWQYPLPRIKGDVHVVRNGLPVDAQGQIQRGELIVVGQHGGELKLGGYCQLELGPQTTLLVGGDRGREEVELRSGSLISRITPQKGEFTCRTPFGPVRAMGTQFVTTVESAGVAQARRTLGKLATVTVVVFSGMVGFDLAGETGTLEAGSSKRIDAGESKSEGPKTSGTVVEVVDLTVTLDTGGERETFVADRQSEMPLEQVSQLLPGDQISLTWEQRGGKKWIGVVSGTGQLQGKVTAKGDTWIEITSDRGQVQRFIPDWLGRQPKDGGGLDKRVLRQIAETPLGKTVAILWTVTERKRVMEIRDVP